MDFPDIIQKVAGTLISKSTSKAQQNAVGKTTIAIISSLKELTLKGKIDGEMFRQSIDGLKVEKDLGAYLGRPKKVEIKLGGSQK